MVISLPHIEDSNSNVYLPPKGEYEPFRDEAHYAEKLKEWGLSAKKQFWYKEATHQRLATIKGYEIYGKTAEFNTIVIQFQDGNLTCIHPAYLKEMQSTSFGKAGVPELSESSSAPITQKQKALPPRNQKQVNLRKPRVRRKKKHPSWNYLQKRYTLLLQSNNLL